MPPNTNQTLVSCHPQIFPAPEALCQKNLSTQVFCFPSSCPIHRKSTSCAFLFSIQISCFPLRSVNSDHHLIIEVIAIYIILCATSCRTLVSSAWVTYIALFVVEFNPSAPCLSISVSSSGSSGPAENKQIVW